MPHLHCTTLLPEAVMVAMRDHLTRAGWTIGFHDGWTAPPAGTKAVVVAPPTRMDAARVATLPASVTMVGTYSVGLDHLDLPALRAAGKIVLHTPDVLNDAVAEVALLLTLGAARRATESIALLRSGGWQGWTPRQLVGVGLSDKTMGIWGMGRIGTAIAQRARAFGMHITYHNRRPVAGDPARFIANRADFLAGADVVMLAAPLTAETRQMLNAASIAQMKPGAIVVNIGRGGLIDDGALIPALTTGRVAAAGLDVFEGEPQLNPGYLTLPNAFLLPHIGSSTIETRMAMGLALVEGVLAGPAASNRVA